MAEGKRRVSVVVDVEVGRGVKEVHVDFGRRDRAEAIRLLQHAAAAIAGFDEAAQAPAGSEPVEKQ